jgi:hypothetical protein
MGLPGYIEPINEDCHSVWLQETTSLSAGVMETLRWVGLLQKWAEGRRKGDGQTGRLLILFLIKKGRFIECAC